VKRGEDILLWSNPIPSDVKPSICICDRPTGILGVRCRNHDWAQKKSAFSYEHSSRLGIDRTPLEGILIRLPHMSVVGKCHSHAQRRLEKAREGTYQYRKSVIVD
jgi:hypothetical protein